MNGVLESLRRFQLAQSAALQRAGEALGVSETDLTALRTLIAAHQDGGVPMKELANEVGVSPAVMTGIVDRLEEKGWIRRQAHSTDRRSTVLLPTVDADERVGRVLVALDEPLRKVANSVSAEAATVVKRLVAAMESELRDFDPRS